jgi:hypothetical protein
LLEIVASDSTFEPIDLQGAPAWAGKCIHCNSRLVVLADGTPVGPVTVEHLVPTSGGGTAALENLALACAGCNHEKGRPTARRGLRSYPPIGGGRDPAAAKNGAPGSALPPRTSTLATGVDERGSRDHRDLEIEGWPGVP